MREEQVDGVIHLAAESHVDRSIRDPFTFAKTNVLGTLSMLQAARIYWEEREEGYKGKMFWADVIPVLLWIAVVNTSS